MAERNQNPTDELLAQRAQQDSKAFAELYRRHLDRVYRYLYSRVGHVQDAQDLTAQTFIAALEGIRSFNGQGVFAAWLLGIARRKAADYYRSNRPDEALELLEDVPNSADTPEASVEQQLQMEQVMRVMTRISPERAEALALRIFGGLSAAEVGQIMGKNEHAVNTLVYRAMRDLRERLVEREVNHDV